MLYGTVLADYLLGAVEAFDKLPDRRLALALLEHSAELRARALALSAREGGLMHGHDYIVMAEGG